MLMLPRGAAGVASPEVADAERRLADVVRFGKVSEVDYPGARVRVLVGDEEDEDGHLITGWLPMPGLRARGDSDWHPLEEGEQVVLLSESGELQNAAVLPLGIYSEENPAPGDKAGLWRKRFKDGGTVEYDRDSGAFLIDAKKKATVKVDQAAVVVEPDAITLTVGGVTLKLAGGKVTIDGGFEVSGSTFTHNNVNVGATHKHLGVTTGGGVSGTPQP